MRSKAEIEKMIDQCESLSESIDDFQRGQAEALKWVLEGEEPKEILIRVFKYISYNRKEELISDAGKNLIISMTSELLQNQNNRIIVDFRYVPAYYLISGFFKGFCEGAKTLDPDLPEIIKKIEWRTDHDFQIKNIKRWLGDYL